MKKLTAMLLALAMVFALCACGGPTEEEARAIELYNKYAGVIDRLEAEDYTGVIQEIAVLINSGKEQEDKTPMGQLMVDEWYLTGVGEEKLNPPKTLSVGADGTVLVDGEAYTWLEYSSYDDGIAGFLLKNGVHTYALEVCQYRDDQVPYAQLWTVEANGDRFYSDDWVGTYYNDAMLGYLLRSWRNLDDNDEVFDSYIDVNRSCANVNDEELDWAITSSGEGTVTADLGGVWTFTVELRGALPIAFLTENATGAQAAYYLNYEEYGYDRSWPEYVYPRALSYLNECVEELAEGYTPGFWDYTVEESVSYSGNAAWQRLYEIFTALGDYKDSAQLAARFTILKDMYTGAENLRVDNMGNESTDREYEVYKYNALGQVTYSETAENHRLYGGDTYGSMYFFYDESGRISKIQKGTGNNVSSVIIPVYDGEGRMVGGTYQSNSYNWELSYAYDDQGRLIENIVWGGDDRFHHTYTYDAAGNLVKDVYWYGWGSNYKYYRYTVDYTYDAQGHLVQVEKVRERYDDYRNEFTLTNSYSWVYTNDAQGRPVSAQYTERDSEGSSSYASQTITYHYEDLYFFE